MNPLISKQEIEKEFGEVNSAEWNYAIQQYGKQLNEMKFTPCKEEQMDSITTLIDEFRRL